MSESENVKRILNQAAEIAKDHIAVLENDVRCLNYQLSQEKKKNRTLGEAIYFSDTEIKSQQKKAETSLLFMFFHGCLCAAVIAYAILNCQ